jgi:opacity protein-like surface antigen
MRHTVHTLLGIAVIAAATAAGAAEGDIPDHPALSAKWYFGAGVFIAKTTTQASLSSSTLGVGAIIDFEDTFGMDEEKTVPGFMARWRINQRWRVEAEYFEFNRSQTRATNREVQWGDLVFPINTQVSSDFDFSDLRVSVNYSFFRTKDKEVGAGLGLHVA